MLQYLGKDLAHHLKPVKKFQLKTILQLADQLLQIMENVHNRSVIHRDIKPENILMGNEKDQKKVYLVDFGISKEFKDKDGNHIPV